MVFILLVSTQVRLYLFSDVFTYLSPLLFLQGTFALTLLNTPIRDRPLNIVRRRVHNRHLSLKKDVWCHIFPPVSLDKGSPLPTVCDGVIPLIPIVVVNTYYNYNTYELFYTVFTVKWTLEGRDLGIMLRIVFLVVVFFVWFYTLYKIMSYLLIKRFMGWS